MIWPTALKLVPPGPLVVADLVMESDGVWAARTVAVELDGVGLPSFAVVAVATAVLATEPASRSAWVTVWVLPVALQVSVAPGAKGAAQVMVIEGKVESVTLTVVKVT